MWIEVMADDGRNNDCDIGVYFRRRIGWCRTDGSHEFFFLSKSSKIAYCQLRYSWRIIKPI